MTEEPGVRIVYQARKDEFIPFADVLAGQRATALMTVLRSEDGGPLIIDQPEDDFRQQGYPGHSSQISSAKSRRQLIFASHNANLVVNGDADLVVVFDYEAAGDQTSGKVAALGSIDNKKVREAVTNVMEGGHAAFGLRGHKYGF